MATHEGSQSEWPAPSKALRAGREFLAESAATTTTLLPDGDADGLCAGVIVERALAALGGSCEFFLLGRTENPHREDVRKRLVAARPKRLVVLDVGSRPGPLVEGVPTLLVDHHMPAGFPADAVVVSSAGSPPIATTSVLAFELVRPLAGGLDELEWLAVLGGIADMGSPPGRERVEKRWGSTIVRDAIALLNAPRRAPGHEVATALEVLRAARSPRDVARGDSPAHRRLASLRATVAAEVKRWSRAAPRISGPVAIISISSQAKVHALLATRWTRRLHDKIVMVANHGYTPGRVHFAVRSARDVDLMEFLRANDPGGTGSEYANGHARATGGSVDHETFMRLAARLGFSPEAAAPRSLDTDRADAQPEAR